MFSRQQIIEIVNHAQPAALLQKKKRMEREGAASSAWTTVVHENTPQYPPG